LFTQDTFLDYLIHIKKRLGKVVMFTDRARQHQSNKVKEYLKANRDSVRLLYFPKGSPEFNAVDEYWRQRKSDILVSKYYPKFTGLK
jgi:transposase